jgi:glycosyltransferase involved in cell wall biosynthesis
VAISVALCTYNGERFIGRQVASILEQTRQADEVVLSDDASADGTVAIAVEAFEEARRQGRAVPELVVLRNPEPLGVTANFESALAACTGELIVLSDQDDEWEPEKLHRIEEAFAARPGLLFLHSDAQLIDDAGAAVGGTLFGALEVGEAERAAVHSGAAFGVFLRRNLATGAASALARELVVLSRPFPPEWVHDEWLAVQAAARERLDLTERVLTRYRRHDANQIGAGDPTLRHKISRVLGTRGDRNLRLASRSAVLRDRLAEAEDVPRGYVAAAAAKAEFERTRAELPASRLRRFVPTLRLALSGDYGRYASRRRLDIIRDLLQPV